jgi:holo-[acyl-carrier protein] synthase
MEIIAIGTHIVECIRIRRMIEKHGEDFLRHVFTEREIRFCQSRRQAGEYFAAYWASKEAILQCLGILNPKRQPWQELEIDHTIDGQYHVTLSGGCQEVMQSRRINQIFLTLSQCRAYASAYVIAIGRKHTE